MDNVNKTLILYSMRDEDFEPIITDLEICEELAEINGYVKADGYYTLTEKYKENPSVLHKFKVEDLLAEFNPLTNDLLCLKMIKDCQIDVKYDVDIDYWDATSWLYEEFTEDDPELTEIRECSKNLNKAVCLSRIRASREFDK